MADAPVTLKNLTEYMNALKVIDPAMAKALRAEMKKPAQKIAASARDEAPPGPLIHNYGQWKRGQDGFDLSYDRSQVQRGIKVTTAKSRISGSEVGASSALRIVSSNAVGILYEKIGKRSGSGTAVRNGKKVSWPQGRHFIRAITGDYSQAPRLLLRIWKRDRGITKSAAAAHRVAEQAIAEVEKRLK
jgi:hypothetical protein